MNSKVGLKIIDKASFSMKQIIHLEIKMTTILKDVITTKKKNQHDYECGCQKELVYKFSAYFSYLFLKKKIYIEYIYLSLPYS